MAASIIYEMSFKNVEETLVKVMIADNAIQTDDPPEIIQLDPAGSPLKISTIDEGENKFTPVKSQQATITFLSNGNTSLETFSDGSDDRFSVSVLYGTTIIFYGFLSLSDNSEAFLPPKNNVVLTANDKLGALKEIPLTDFGGSVVGVNPQGKYTIGQLIAMCLQKTGLSLELRVINNLRHGTGVKSFQATFGSPSAQVILMDNINAQFFYVGQRVLVSGTSSNNVEFTVFSVSTGFLGAVSSETSFTLEADVVATFTDVSSADHIYKGTYLDAKTFEEEIGVSEDCYTVLEKILGFDCFITQYKECWWICRIDEYDGNDLYVSRFDENGEYIDSYVETTLSKNIGFNETHWLSDEATIVQPMRPIGFAKLTYNFEYPEEIVCNQDFARGTGDAVDDTNPNQTIEYDLECWDVFSRGEDDDTLTNFPPDPTASFKLIKRFEFGYEKERYLKTLGAAVPVGETYFESSPLRVAKNDKIELSFDFRVLPDQEILGGSIAYVILFADSGNVWEWYLHNDGTGIVSNRWSQNFSGSYWVNTWTYLSYLDQDTTEWVTMGATSLPVPEKGTLIIRLINPFANPTEVHFSELKITFLAFTNGSYRAYNGRYEKVSTALTGYLANIDDEVYISDAERELFKGAMFFLADSIYMLTVKWYDASKFALGNPDLDRVQPYGKHQAYSVWNQYRLANRIFQYQFQGFGSDIPSLVHKYTITDVSGHSENRNFFMLTKDADLFLCNQTGVLEQVYHTEEGKIYTDEHEFKYIS